MRKVESRRYSFKDYVLIEIDHALTTVLGTVHSSRANPAEQFTEQPMTAQERRQSEGFLRVDHTGEVCAQALYRGHLVSSSSEETRAMLQQACAEEVDHLSWTQERLNTLGGRRSYLNCYWYLHSFCLGVFVGFWGDRWSLGFVEETERQVSRHLQSHLSTLPAQDLKSRAIVAQMRTDEEKHGQQAHRAGARTLPAWAQTLMRWHAKVMTVLVYYV